MFNKARVHTPDNNYDRNTSEAGDLPQSTAREQLLYIFIPLLNTSCTGSSSIPHSGRGSFHKISVDFRDAKSSNYVQFYYENIAC
ncbi:hypothetical protein RclHR1_08360003 [Rhizophagus clarus]|uniref:Uncharacterized protein n=1 Tax=Rhizophagus clarus TaxID=94130 RepID=A0A2Z6SMZ7_9GLOM|nr:hypothetical protein RclHR1_08360003 [Rhizophagus clarus]GET01468.1 hypothetical protein RCL_e26502_RclHR1_08360003 [Rhizophagus clarus]